QREWILYICPAARLLVECKKIDGAIMRLQRCDQLHDVALIGATCKILAPERHIECRMLVAHELGDIQSHEAAHGKRQNGEHAIVLVKPDNDAWSEALCRSHMTEP